MMIRRLLSGSQAHTRLMTNYYTACGGKSLQQHEGSWGSGVFRGKDDGFCAKRVQKAEIAA
ncbi:hypothetical protein BJF91_07170 [Allorhizobium taibaishanense]|uniref:Uncharacterized protein n=1 Tax=Allorhizobium taibaishanense TaxID=887144 RepID=A0A1Q9A8S0_9HYPH|nr:hypothetical protein BJF91_07170 [Allorhizobium taibaishanense]